MLHQVVGPQIQRMGGTGGVGAGLEHKNTAVARRRIRPQGRDQAQLRLVARFDTGQGQDEDIGQRVLPDTGQRVADGRLADSPPQTFA